MYTILILSIFPFSNIFWGLFHSSLYRPSVFFFMSEYYHVAVDKYLDLINIYRSLTDNIVASSKYFKSPFTVSGITY